MKTLDNYSRLTIRILGAKIIAQNSDDGYGYRHLFTCDEIPECSLITLFSYKLGRKCS